MKEKQFEKRDSRRDEKEKGIQAEMENNTWDIITISQFKNYELARFQIFQNLARITSGCPPPLARRSSTLATMWNFPNTSKANPVHGLP